MNLSAMQWFVSTPECCFDIDLDRFTAPTSAQYFCVPDVHELLAWISHPWGDRIKLDSSLATLPDLHPSTICPLQHVPIIESVPDFQIAAYHIFTDGSFTRGSAAEKNEVEGDDTSGWALAVVVESCDGDFALAGVMGDVISSGTFDEQASRHLGLAHHSALGSEYTADVSALLYILQRPAEQASFCLYGDCLGPLHAAEGVGSWANEPCPHLCATIALIVEQRKWNTYRHVKSRDWHL